MRVDVAKTKLLVNTNIQATVIVNRCILQHYLCKVKPLQTNVTRVLAKNLKNGLFRSNLTALSTKNKLFGRTKPSNTSTKRLVKAVTVAI